MKALFRNLASANLMLLLIAVVWGHLLPGDGSGRATFDTFAVVVAVFNALVHSIVYTYFIASGKFVQSAVEEHGYPDASAIDRSKANKRKAFRYAFLAIAATMAAVFLHFASSPVRGEAAMWGGWAAIGAYLMLLVNAWATKVEWKYVVANSVLTDEVLERVTEARERREAAAGAGRPAMENGT